jgi:DNA-binding protein H-NS
MNLKSMSVAKLTHLKEQIETTLRATVAARRKAIESDLARLARFGKSSGSARMGKVPPKYRNPDNPSETWAGRGLQPRWLAAALKSGRKLEHFAIAAPTRAAVAKRAPRKTRRAARKI